MSFRWGCGRAGVVWGRVMSWKWEVSLAVFDVAQSSCVVGSCEGCVFDGETCSDWWTRTGRQPMLDSEWRRQETTMVHHHKKKRRTIPRTLEYYNIIDDTREYSVGGCWAFFFHGTRIWCQIRCVCGCFRDVMTRDLLTYPLHRIKKTIKLYVMCKEVFGGRRGDCD